MSANEFLGFYLASGVLSGLASTLFSIALRSPQRSLGASGALFSVLGYYTLSHPDNRVVIMFIFDMTAMQVRSGRPLP